MLLQNSNYSEIYHVPQQNSKAFLTVYSGDMGRDVTVTLLIQGWVPERNSAKSEKRLDRFPTLLYMTMRM